MPIIPVLFHTFLVSFQSIILTNAGVGHGSSIDNEAATNIITSPYNVSVLT